MTSTKRVPSPLLLALALAITAAAPGCFLTDADIPAGVELECDDTADCPPTWTCNTTTGLCNAPGGIVFDGPALVDRTHFGPESKVEFSFTLSDTVQSSESGLVVELRDLDSRESIEGAVFTQDGADGRTFTYSLDGAVVAARGIAEGRYGVTVLATSTDSVASVLSADVVTWDSTAPDVDTSATALNGRVGIVSVDGEDTPLNVVSASSSIVATVLANEALSARDDEPVTVELRRDDTVAATFVVDTIGIRDARLTAAPEVGTLSTGLYDVVVVTLADLAGNTLEEPVVAGQLFVDVDRPVFDLFVASPTLVSRINPVVTLCARIEDALLLTGDALADTEVGDTPFRVGTSFPGTEVVCRSEADGLDACAPAPSDARTFECTLDTHVDDNPESIEDAFVIFGFAEDIAGNVIDTTEVVVVDTAPAKLVGGSIRLNPPPLSDVTAPRSLTLRSSLFVTLNTDELVQANTVDATPTSPPAFLVCPPESAPVETGDAIEPGPGHFPLVPSPQATPPASFFAYTASVGVLPNAINPPEGTCAIEFWLSDVAGNFSAVRPQNDGQFVAVTPLVPQSTEEMLVVIDKTPPQVASTAVERLLHVRAPWGLPLNTIENVENVNVLHAIVDTEVAPVDVDGSIPDVGVDVLADPGIAREVIDPDYAQGVVAVLLYDREEAITPIGFIAPDLVSDGSESDPIAGWAPAVVGTADAAQVWLRLIDEAGNPSAPVRVDHGMWFATINRKIAGVDFQNPHALFSQPTTGNSLSIVGANEASLPAPAVADLDLTTGGAASFAALASPRRPPQMAFGAMATDPINARTFLFGGDTNPATFPTPSNEMWVLNGARWDRICETAAECGGIPQGRFDHMMIYDARNAAMLIAGGVVKRAGNSFEVSNELFAFVDDTFGPVSCNQITNGDCSVLTVRGGAAAYDTERAAIWVAGGCSDLACSLLDQSPLNFGEVKGGRIERVVAPGPVNRHRAAFAFDPARDVFVLHGGCTTLACTTKLRDTWTFDPIERTWTEVAINPGFNDQGASPKLVYLPSELGSNAPGVLVLIGASRNGADEGEVFAFTGDAWTLMNTGDQIGPDANPQPFENVFNSEEARGFAAIVDAAGRLITMGGVGEVGGQSSRDTLATRVFTRKGSTEVVIDGTLVDVPNLERTTLSGSSVDALADFNQLHSEATLFHSPSATEQDGSLSISVQAALGDDPLRLSGSSIGRFEGDGFSTTTVEGASNCSGFEDALLPVRFSWATARTGNGSGGLMGHAFQYSVATVITGGTPSARYGSFLRGEDVGNENYFAMVDDAGFRSSGDVLRQANPAGDLFLTGFDPGSGAGSTSVLRFIANPNVNEPVWDVVAQPGFEDQLPPALIEPAVGYSPPAGAAVMANGDVVDGNDSEGIDAVWAFNGVGWARIEITNPPNERPRRARGAALEWHDRRQRFVMTGGYSVVNDLVVCEDEVWELQINPDITATFLPVRTADPEGDGSPRSRHGAAMAFGDDGMLLASGNARQCDGSAENLFLTDAWRYRSPFGKVPGQIFRVNVAASGLPDETRFLVAGTSWTAGATALAGNGVVNAIWSSGRWVAIGDDNNAPIESPQALTSTVKVDDSAELDRIFTGDTDAIHVMVRSKHPNQQGFSQVRTESSPLVFLRYLLP